MSRTYFGPPMVRAVRDTSLDIRRGEFVTIMGRSGSGKSTLLNLIGLLDRPSTGTYEFGGTDVACLTDPQRAFLRGRRIGFVFQSFHLLPHRSVLENVVIAQLYNGTPRSRRVDAACETLGRVGLRHLADAMPTTLSGGECQRVALARALVNRPDLLLCDEVTGNLDSLTANSVLSEIEDLWRSGQTIVMITHDESIGLRGHRRLEMRDGVLTEPPRGDGVIDA